MFLDELADFVAVFIGHDHVGDDRVGSGVAELRKGRGGVRAGDNVYIFLAEGDLDDFAHGGAVVNEIDRRSAGGGESRRFAHSDSFSTLSGAAGCSESCWAPSSESRCDSSNSRMASRSRSVAERSTVRCVAVAPYTNL